MCYAAAINCLLSADLGTLCCPGDLPSVVLVVVVQTGYTRVPICDGSESDPQSPIVGLLLTKDLMLVDPV